MPRRFFSISLLLSWHKGFISRLPAFQWPIITESLSSFELFPARPMYQPFRLSLCQPEPIDSFQKGLSSSIFESVTNKRSRKKLLFIISLHNANKSTKNPGKCHMVSENSSEQHPAQNACKRTVAIRGALEEAKFTGRYWKLHKLAKDKDFFPTVERKLTWIIHQKNKKRESGR